MELPPLVIRTEESFEVKTSESERLAISPKKDLPTQQRPTGKKATRRHLDNDDVSVISIPAVKRSVDPSSYFTDTSEVEDLMESSGVGGHVTPQAKSTPTFSEVPMQRRDSKRGDDSCNEQPGPSQEQPQMPRQLSASSRTLLRKHFIEKDPIFIPRN